MRLRERNLLDQIERDALDKKVSVSDVLRKLIALGGKAGSKELCDWASLELRGYQDSEVPMPDYRLVPASIQLDGIQGHYHVTGEQISPHQFPGDLGDVIKEQVPFNQSIDEVEELLRLARDRGHLKLLLPGTRELVMLMNHELAGTGRSVTSLYWSVSPAPISNIIDRVRTTLVELVAEMRAGMPDDADVPSASVADQAVGFAVHGNGNRVTFQNAPVSGTRNTSGGVAVASDPESRFAWLRAAGTAAVGIATIAAAMFAYMQLVNA